MSPAAVAAAGAAMLGTLLCAGGLGAEVLSAGGLTFSDERGGFRLIAASGTGTRSDPLILVEEFTQMGPAILVIRGFKTRGQDDPDRPIQAISSGSLVVTKVVLNRSRRVWTGFDLELREIVDTPSPYGDGLSFDQMGSFAPTFGSDRFRNIRKLTEPYDLLDFHQGSVDPGVRGAWYTPLRSLEVTHVGLPGTRNCGSRSRLDDRPRRSSRRAGPRSPGALVHNS